MKIHTVTIRETLEQTVYVSAISSEEAESIVSKLYHDEEIVLMPENITELKFIAK